MGEIKDIIIIGGGPAGITAAIYSARKKLNFSVITKDIGGQAAWSGDIENYTGYQFITGPDLTKKFREHLDQFKFDLQEGIEVKKIEKDKNGFKVVLLNNNEMFSKSVIIASGKMPRLLNVIGEEKFKGKGVTYCATCDGPVFSGKNVAIIGGGNSALDAALQMTKISPKIYLINLNPTLGGDAVLREKVEKADNVEILNNTNTKEIIGDKFVRAIKVETDGDERELPVKGVFIEIGLIPNSDIIDFVDKNDSKEININCFAETSEPGVFAAGDVSDVPQKQIIIAAGDGAKAALAAYRYLSTH